MKVYLKNSVVSLLLGLGLIVNPLTYNSTLASSQFNGNHVGTPMRLPRLEVVTQDTSPPVSLNKSAVHFASAGKEKDRPNYYLYYPTSPAELTDKMVEIMHSDAAISDIAVKVYDYFEQYLGILSNIDPNSEAYRYQDELYQKFQTFLRGAQLENGIMPPSQNDDQNFQNSFRNWLTTYNIRNITYGKTEVSPEKYKILETNTYYYYHGLIKTFQETMNFNLSLFPQLKDNKAFLDQAFNVFLKIPQPFIVGNLVCSSQATLTEQNYCLNDYYILSFMGLLTLNLSQQFFNDSIVGEFKEYRNLNAKEIRIKTNLLVLSEFESSLLKFQKKYVDNIQLFSPRHFIKGKKKKR